MINQKKAIFGYWPLAGNGQVLRYLLSYVGAPWKDKLYFERSEWFSKDKEQLNLNFPNLPYLIDGNLRLTQTSALIRYIPKRWGYPQLLGKSILDQLHIDTYLGILQDVWSTISPLIFSENWSALKADALSKVKPLLNNLNKQVEEEWALKYLTVVDFRLADIVGLAAVIFSEHRDEWRRLLAIRDRVYEIPEVKKYREMEGAVLDLVPRHSTIPV